MWIVYMTTDLKTGKIYIGKHKVEHNSTLDSRYFGSGIIIARLKKERPQDLTRDILCQTDNDEDACILERFFVNVYESDNPLVGYNIAKGGRGTMGVMRWLQLNNPVQWGKTRQKMVKNGRVASRKWGFQKGHKPSAETREKIRKALTGRQMSDEQKQKMKDWYREHPVSKETREKISKANKGKRLSKESIAKRTESRRGWRMPEEARQKISTANKGKCRSAEISKRVGEYNRLHNPQRVRIRSITTGKVYNSLHDACRDLGNMGYLPSLSRCINGKLKTCAKQKWEKIE